MANTSVIVGLRTHSKEARALELLMLLEEYGPIAAGEAVKMLGGWSRSQFDAAVRYARDVVCPPLGVTIPAPVPEDGWRYRVTNEWQPDNGDPAIAAGVAWSISQVETRLHSVLRDVRIAKRNLDPRSVDGRKCNFLDKHLTHILGTLAEIGTARKADLDEG